ncbi:uncharacterized protein LOC131307840 [Rhododendron vialii]|uniref:uncharacterized protein LOC131307840 n=1 Tax=Rhododendron vialii TaxID=182163 RepID=UPI00265FD5EE|nr:uncharacterized protein LOC131307840 [Rhododendron vialii]
MMDAHKITMSGETNTKQKQQLGMRRDLRDRISEMDKAPSPAPPMEDCMRECMRKLGLWYTRTFKPFMTHEELEPIMASLGFVPLPSYIDSSLNGAGAVWRDYAYSAYYSPRGGGEWRRSITDFPEQQRPPPRPRLPYPRIDGLHIYTYTAFLDALNFYLRMTDISDLFHIRGMPLHKVHDRSKLWRRMEEDDSVFVYREGTLDQVAYASDHKNKNDLTTVSKGCNSMLIRS